MHERHKRLQEERKKQLNIKNRITKQINNSLGHGPSTINKKGASLNINIQGSEFSDQRSRLSFKNPAKGPSVSSGDFDRQNVAAKHVKWDHIGGNALANKSF